MNECWYRVDMRMEPKYAAGWVLVGEVNTREEAEKLGRRALQGDGVREVRVIRCEAVGGDE
jgi:hypothetical protein